MRIYEFHKPKLKFDLKKEQAKSAKILKSWYNEWSANQDSKISKEEYVNQKFYKYMGWAN